MAGGGKAVSTGVGAGSSQEPVKPSEIPAAGVQTGCERFGAGFGCRPIGLCGLAGPLDPPLYGQARLQCDASSSCATGECSGGQDIVCCK